MVRGICRLHRGQQHIWPLRLTRSSLPAPQTLSPALCPSPYFHHTDFFFFFSVFKIHTFRSCLRAFTLAVSSPWEALFFLIPSQHWGLRTNVTSRDIQSPTQLCPHPYPAIPSIALPFFICIIACFTNTCCPVSLSGRVSMPRDQDQVSLVLPYP